MAKQKNRLKDNNVVKGFATAIVVVFILAIFIWTLDPNMRDQVWQYLHGGNDFVTVEGESILSAGQIKNLIENRKINFRNFPDALIVQSIKNFKEVNREINKAIMMKYAKDIGLEMSPKAKQILAIELYKKSKVQFEKRYNIRFRMKLVDFYEIAQEQYLTSLVNNSLTQGILITKDEAELKYKLENNRRKLKYATYEFEQFVKTKQFPKEELQKFYKSSEAASFRSNVKNRVSAIGISGNDKKEMQKLLQKIRTTPGLFEQEAKKQNAKTMEYVITKATKELNPLRQITPGKYSKVITRTIRGQKKYFIFKVVKHHKRKFNELNNAELAELKGIYAKSNAARNKFLSEFQTKVKAKFKNFRLALKNGGNFDTEARKRGFNTGITEYFPIALKDAVDKNIHDPVQNEKKRPIKMFKSSNTEFLKSAFSLKKGGTSELQNVGFTYYMFKVLDINNAPKMNAADYKKYLVAMRKRQRNEYMSKIIQELYKKYQVKWHDKNIIKLIRALQGRRS